MGLGHRTECHESLAHYSQTAYRLSAVSRTKKPPDLEEMFKIIKKYLKPGGTLLDIDWTDSKLSEEKYEERKSYNWYSNQGPSIEEIETLIKSTGFIVRKNEVLEVKNPEEYGWGKIYTISAQAV